MRPGGPVRAKLLLLLVVLIGGVASDAVATPAPGKWEGPPVPGPLGGVTRTTIYYGPWQCSKAWMTSCEEKCASRSRKLIGCIWLADIKTDWQGRFAGVFPASAGGRLAITHCCCDYAEVKDTLARRETWRSARDGFRRKWSEEFGEWPRQGDTNWPGHHIHDLLHGGDPVAEWNVLPVQPDIHEVFNKEYPICYTAGGKWSRIGPDRPYTD